MAALTDIKDKIFIRAGTETVFSYLTEADLLDKWWPAACQSDPREGGELNFTWANGSGLSTRYKVFDRPVRLEYEFYREYLAFDLQAKAQGCVLSVRHRRVPFSTDDVSQALHVAQVWPTLLISLKVLIEHGIELKGDLAD